MLMLPQNGENPFLVWSYSTFIRIPKRHFPYRIWETVFCFNILCSRIGQTQQCCQNVSWHETVLKICLLQWGCCVPAQKFVFLWLLNCVRLEVLEIAVDTWIFACRSAYLTVLKMCKLLLTVIGHVMARVVDDPQPSPPQQNECGGPDGNGLGNLSLCSISNASTPTVNSPRSPVAVLRQALHSIPNQNTEYMLRSVASKLAQNLAEQVSRSILILSSLSWT
jgi:hypothetical protein